MTVQKGGWDYFDEGWAKDANGNLGGRKVVTAPAGPFISQENLSLSASSQALPTIPTGARVALIQVHGGTVTDRVYVSLDGSAATTADFFMKNVEDTTANIGGPTELYIVGDLADVRILGTANASVAWVGYFA